MSERIKHQVISYLEKYGYNDDVSLSQRYDDSVLRNRLFEFQHFNYFTYQAFFPDYKPTGKIDDETLNVMSLPRCGCPDTTLLPQGSGSWDVGCHTPGIHEVTIKVDPRGMPNRLQPIFKDVVDLVIGAYKEIGMLLNFDPQGRNINIDFSFEYLRGAIGLAIVPNNPGCRNRIWCKYDPRYNPSDMLNQWARLLAHELGHNMGLSHYRGGIMNSYILSGKFTHREWVGDPAENLLRRWFGIPIPDPNPPGKITNSLILTDKNFYSNEVPVTLKIGDKVYKS